MRVRGLVVGLTGLAGLLVANPGRSQLGAQTSAQPALVPIANRSYIGINPLGIPFDIFSIEGETAVAQGITLGGVASYTDADHDRWQSADFKFRYYPGDVVLRGLSFGGTVGYLNYSAPVCCGASGRASVSTPTVGIIGDYNWLLGLDHRFLVGTGVGVKRVLASEDARSASGLGRVVVTARFTIGLAF